MKSESALKEALEVLPLISIGGPWTRAVGYHLLQGPPPGTPPDAPPQPLWPGAPASTGARFTPKGSFGTVYLASDPITALIEVAGIFLNPHAPMTTLRTPPWAVFAVEGVVQGVLDLADPDVVEEIETSFAELSGDWRFSQALFLKGLGLMPPTQLLGKAAHESVRVQGIRYHAAKNLGQGLGFAFFPDRMIRGEASRLQVFDPHGFIEQRLP